MRYYNKVELRLVPGGTTGLGAEVFDICSRQSESNRLHRIAALERENELLRRAASAIQVQLASQNSGNRGWLEAMVRTLSQED